MVGESGKSKKKLTETKKQVYKKKKADPAHEVDKSKQINKQGQACPKPRMKWDDYMHNKFLRAVQLVGIGAGPAKIMEVMNMEGLTRLHVSSHIQKFRLRMKKLGKEMAALGASSRDGFRMQEAVGMPSSIHNWRCTSGTKKEANSPAWFAPPTIINDRPLNFSTPYHFGLTYCNQLASEQNNQMAFNHSPYTQSNLFVPPIDLTNDNFYEQQLNSGANSSWPSSLNGTTCTQSNFVEWPAVNGRENMNNISNSEANVETLIKNPSVPPVYLTDDDINYQQQQIGGAFVTSQLNFNSGASPSWYSNLITAAAHRPISGDGFIWDGVAVNERNDVPNVAVQNPDDEPLFVNPINILDMMSVASSEQNEISASAVYHDSYNSTVMSSAEDPSSVDLGEDLSKINDGFLNDEVDGFFINNSDAIESSGSAVLSNETNGTREINGGRMESKQENNDVGNDIGVESSQWNYILDLDLPYYHEEWNDA